MKVKPASSAALITRDFWPVTLCVESSTYALPFNFGNFGNYGDFGNLFMNKAHLLTIASVVAADRITKHLIEQHIPLDQDIEVIPGFFRLTHLENPGGAFSLFAGSASRWRTPALIVFAIAALVIVSVLLWKNRQMNLKTAALSLVFGGTVGNLWDRVASGEVTDFLDFYAGSYHWYPFNIADSAIVIGGLLLAWRIFFDSAGKGNHRDTA